MTKKNAAPTAPAPAVVLPDFPRIAYAGDAAALLAQAGAPPIAPPTEPGADDTGEKAIDLRALLDLYEQTPEANVTQRAAIMREIRSGAGSQIKIDTKQTDIKKQETAAKLTRLYDFLSMCLKGAIAGVPSVDVPEDLRANVPSGVHRADFDGDDGSIVPVKGKSKERDGGNRKSVTKEDMSAAGVQTFILPSGEETIATVRGSMWKAHPYAYMLNAHPAVPFFGRNMFDAVYTLHLDETGGEDTDAARAAFMKNPVDAERLLRAHFTYAKEMTPTQIGKLKVGVLSVNDDPARLMFKYGQNDTTTRARYADGSEKTVKDFIAGLDA